MKIVVIGGTGRVGAMVLKKLRVHEMASVKRRKRMTFTRIALVLVYLMSTTLVAQEAKVTQLMSKDLRE